MRFFLVLTFLFRLCFCLPATASTTSNLKIDAHHHIFPPDMRKLIENTPLSAAFQVPEWSPEMSLDFMKNNSIGTSILSSGIPLSVFGKSQNETAALCREYNKYMASLRDKNPSKIGFFATLPSLEDVPRSLEEIQYAFSVLKADGIALFTSYSNKYLGHPDFEPVWEELNRRKAVVFMHPTLEGAILGIPQPFMMPAAVFDWPHETTRAAMHLILTNSVRKFPNVKRILTHGGGTLPYVAGRIADSNTQAQIGTKDPSEFLEDARSFYFDLALIGHKEPLQLLMNFAREGHILYGSDYPFAREDLIAKKARVIDTMTDSKGVKLTTATRKAAKALFPRLA